MELSLLVRKAERLAHEGDYGPEAVRLNTQILEQDDRQSGAYTRLGKCFSLAGNMEAAREMYLQVLAFEPTNRIAIQSLRRIAEQEGLATTRLIPTFEEAFAIGVSAKRRGERDLAVAALERAVKLDRRSVAVVALASAYRSLGRYPEAIQAYKEILSEEPANVAAMVGLAAVLSDSHVVGQALELCKTALAILPGHVYALRLMGSIYVKMGELPEAERCFSEAGKSGEALEFDHLRVMKDLKNRYQRGGNLEGARRITILLRALGAEGGGLAAAG